MVSIWCLNMFPPERRRLPMRAVAIWMYGARCMSLRRSMSERSMGRLAAIEALGKGGGDGSRGEDAARRVRPTGGHDSSSTYCASLELRAFRLGELLPFAGHDLGWGGGDEALVGELGARALHVLPVHFRCPCGISRRASGRPAIPGRGRRPRNLCPRGLSLRRAGWRRHRGIRARGRSRGVRPGPSWP